MASAIRPEDLPPVPLLGASDALIVDTGSGVFKTTPAEILVASGADTGLRADLADPTGPALVSFGTETVEDFLESVPRLGYDVIINGNVTLGLDAFGRIHDVTAAATITFPNPGSSLNGGFIVIRPNDACTGLVTLSGPFVYGATSIVAWAGEQLELEWYATGLYYRIRTWERRLMGGKISREAGNIALTDGVYSDFLVDTPSNDRGSFDLGIAANPLYFDSTNKRFKAARTGQWRLVATLSISPAALVTATLTICKNGETQNLDVMTEEQFASGVRQTIQCEFEGFLNKDDYLIPRVKVTGGTGTVDNSVNGYITVLEVK